MFFSPIISVMVEAAVTKYRLTNEKTYTFNSCKIYVTQNLSEMKAQRNRNLCIFYA